MIQGGAKSFLTDAAATTYPATSTTDVCATTQTAGSSSVKSQRISSVQAIIVEKASAAGTITVTDHNGATTSIVLTIAAAGPPFALNFGSTGMELGGVGIKATSSDAGNIARIVYTIG